MFEQYCRLCKEYYSGCFKEETNKHKDCKQPPLKLHPWFGFIEKLQNGEPLIVESITVSEDMIMAAKQTDIRKILEENSLKDFNELAKDS